jgi:two-component system, chemotaxis family, protein-glutamate methylesterase/glutaminase
VAKIRVLIVDDSALMRELLTALLSNSGMEVVAAVADPYAAWNKIQTLQPDVITLDVEMPKMDGLTFLEKLMRAKPMPAVMVSVLTERGCETTLRALELGAVDYVTKPKVDANRAVHEIGLELVAKVRAAASAKPRRSRASLPAARAEVAPRSQRQYTTAVIAIGASTGGTEALREVLSRLPRDIPGLLIVQHMPAPFTARFAARLNALCAINVGEAGDGARISPGVALIAPGDRHLEVERIAGAYHVRLHDGPPVNHHRPSVDVLFASCARLLGPSAMAVVLTGMGSDGARGLASMKRAGARTLVQDEATSVVFGMPKEAIATGCVDEIVPLDGIAAAIVRLG